MFDELGPRETSIFVLECHRALRKQMIEAMMGGVDNGIIPRMFKKAFTGNDYVLAMFEEWEKTQPDTENTPEWKMCMRFMNCLIYHEEIIIKGIEMFGHNNAA